ncbi:serine/threonine protein kinase [Paucibacter sp. KCTC 42545]|uniref:serine/threonine protein kinase n=1 Tax=Paucibacter sp. KCTC 42545 TaxID=1768242 RepID=UPI0009E737DF|nr:hypothetical protein [Paucibacter sp. KCTC 42545]
MRMPELALPPPAAPALLGVGAALGVWRVRQALAAAREAAAASAGPVAQWYEASHALAKDKQATVLLLPRSERAMGLMLRFGDLAADFEQLGQPMIAVPTDSGVTPQGQPYLVFEQVQGGQPLLQAAAAMPLRARIELLLSFCEALRALHTQGWLWAEIDPAMLWLDRRQQLKLMALGLLRMADPSDPFEHVMALSSAPGYASPEVAAGHPPSLASEVFGVGQLLAACLDEASLASLSPKDRFSLEALIRKAHAKQVDFRYGCVEALADDLRAWLAGDGHSALRFQPMPSQRAPQAQALVSDAAASAWGGAKSKRGRSLWLAAGGVALSLTLAGWLGRDAVPSAWAQRLAGGVRPSPSQSSSQSANAKPSLLSESGGAADKAPADASTATAATPAATNSVLTNQPEPTPGLANAAPKPQAQPLLRPRTTPAPASKLAPLPASDSDAKQAANQAANTGRPDLLMSGAVTEATPVAPGNAQVELAPPGGLRP